MLRYNMLPYITLHCVDLHFVTFLLIYVMLHLCCFTLCYVYVDLRYVSLC